MKFKYLILFFQLLLFFQPAFCQKKDKTVNEDEALQKSSKETPTNLAVSKFQINDIKTRGVIVRLKTNKDRINAYLKAGNIKVADKMKKEATENNLMLMDAFVSHWTYCPVYFMESQHTLKLLQEDSLVAKTFDLERDTIIYMNHDSVYIIDYGVLLENGPATDNTNFKDVNKTEQSNNPVSDGCLVVKDGRSMQLQFPFPYFTKVSLVNLGGFSNHNSIKDVAFTIKENLDLLRLMLINKRSKEQSDTVIRLLAMSFNYLESFHNQNKFQKSVLRLNNKFIAYFCKRLDKDRNILCNDDPFYWWQRNPNIQYLQALPMLEAGLKINAYQDAKFTK